MATSEQELFASVDAMLGEEPQLPPPAERARLREAAGINQARPATARPATTLKTSTQSINTWSWTRACRCRSRRPGSG
ncbi:hypothetical protein [Streptomyces cellulosae]|uniref:hypothetical protein n=1 Tax=Streptomyces cellulosae TaxID=1968 RepID=UPI0004C5B7DB|nr:hypothetical protein [Streptomyces cellulosae]